jgi:hypothetical protein
VRAVRGGSDVEEVGSTYSTQMHRWFTHDVTGLTSLYEIFPAWRERGVA